MLPIQIRFNLRGYPDFFQQAQIVRTKHLIVYFMNIAELTNLQAAVVVKKRAGEAVERAKIRRILRAVITELWQQNPQLFAQSTGLVIIPHGKRQTYADYRQELSEALQQIKNA